MKYVLVVGVSRIYYSGRNEKYSDMFNVNTKEFAKRFDTFEEAKEVADNLNKVGYKFNVEEDN